MNNSIIFSIVMPAYNSEKTIGYSLSSIRKQKYDLSKVECLVVDGGSTDKTIEIAKKYSFVRILKNEKRLPEYAKLIGFKEAQGKYIIKLDSDEAFKDINCLTKREAAFKTFPEANLLISDKLDYIKGYGIAGYYINACGDPFTYFMYRPKETILKTYKNNIIHSKGKTKLLAFQAQDKHPIADGGATTFNAQYIRQFYPRLFDDVSGASSVSDVLIEDNGLIICIEKDNISHRSKANFKGYINKIKFRVINNVFQKTDAGFTNRQISNNKKKYLFPLYVVSFVFPLIDSIILSFRYKSISMMLHLLYCYITLFLLVCYFIIKMFNKHVEIKKY